METQIINQTKLSDDVVRRLKEVVPNAKENASLAKCSTWKIGGDARILLTVGDVQQLQKVMVLLKEYEVPYCIVGKGSNVLFPDGKCEMAAIRFAGDFKKVVSNHVGAGEEGASPVQPWGLYQVGAGATMAALGQAAAKNNDTGLEFTLGIPGTVGGSLFMNAGAMGQEMKDTVQGVTVLTNEGEVKGYAVDKSMFGYRTSDFQKNGDIVLFAEFLLPTAEAGMNVLKESKEQLAIRKDKQPYNEACAGSVFRNPLPEYAAKLIEDVGLKGFSLGGVAVSEKHANFIVKKNKTATELDVRELIRHIQVVVKEQKGVELHREVIFADERMIRTWEG